MSAIAFPLGVALGLMVGPTVPLASRTSSSLSPDVGLFLGYRLDRGALHVQPELSARLSSTGVTAGPGVVVTSGSTLALGGYAHVTSTIFGYFFLPGADAGLAAELRAFDHMTVSGRLGWELVHPALAKCGNCPQPSNNWAGLLVGTTFTF